MWDEDEAKVEVEMQILLLLLLLFHSLNTTYYYYYYYLLCGDPPPKKKGEIQTSNPKDLFIPTCLTCYPIENLSLEKLTY